LGKPLREMNGMLTRSASYFEDETARRKPFT